MSFSEKKLLTSLTVYHVSAYAFLIFFKHKFIIYLIEKY